MLRRTLALAGLTGLLAASAAVAADAALPKLPKTGCFTFSDVKGDGSIGSYEPVDSLGGDSPVDAFGVGLPNDPDLDIVDVTFQAAPTAFRVFLHMDDLADTSSSGAANVWREDFTINGKAITLTAYGPTSPADDAVTAAGFGFAPVEVNGTAANVGLKLTQDTTDSYAILELDRAQLETAIGALEPGTAVTNVLMRSAASYAFGFETADTAAPGAATGYQVGVDPCFGPPPAKITNAGVTTVQYTDAAKLAVKLTDGSGKALAGKKVAFTFATKTATATSGSDGIARTSINPGMVAGSYPLKATFAGDDSAAAAEFTGTVKVAAEKTKVALTVAKSGTKRTATAKLLDDDSHVIAGQSVNWYVNGKKVTTTKTSSSGSTTYAGAKPGQTVKAEFVAVSGKYLGSTATLKV